MGGLADELAGAIDDADACANAGLKACREGVSERRRLLHMLANGDILHGAVVMVVMPWTCFSGRKRQSEDRGANKRRVQVSHFLVAP
ncbi:hypothetical protein [Bradyrhizobium elkanii]